MKEKPMNEETKTALLGSIEKWKAIEDGTGIDLGPRNCPLCEIFWNEYRCGSCPVKKKTRRSVCKETPYQEWEEHHNSNHRNFNGLENLCPTCSELAKEEREFLESLLV
jgi:hypothetical protein